MIRLYDSHAHLADPRLRPRLPVLAAECRAHGLAGVLAAAARHGEWAEITRLAAAGPPVYGALGIHPFFVAEWEAALVAEARGLLQSCPGLVAVGEIGLDLYDGRSGLGRQLAAFEAQLQLALELDRAVVLHNRRSWPEFLGSWRRLGCAGRLRGFCHHFSGSRELARDLLDAGLYLSFCGPLTYPQSRRLREVAAYAPLDRLLVETDAPDLPVQAHRGELSLPWHVAEVLATLAEVRGDTVGRVAAAVERNFHAVLGLRLERPVAP